jgi:hypothetical protein
VVTELAFNAKTRAKECKNSGSTKSLPTLVL